MSPLEILAAAGLAGALPAVIHIVVSRPVFGNAMIAAMLAAAFAAFTALTIANEGVLLVWTNHTSNLWGVQVWWDLLFSVTIALFFIAPRAHQAGMNIPLWALLVVSTASIGLLAMVARLFWLERRENPAG
jgi:hypothetical protein